MLHPVISIKVSSKVTLTTISSSIITSIVISLHSFFNPVISIVSKVFHCQVFPKSHLFVLSSDDIQTPKSWNHVSISNICHQFALAIR
jgi:hypothetical protein